MELYEYLPLREAVLRKGQAVNFYGVISEYEHPKPTRGSDDLCTLTVVDMSYNETGLRLLVFASPANCPLAKSIGDIIQVHGVHMGEYRGKPQAIAKVGRESGFLLFEGKSGKGYEPYQKGNNTFSFEQQHDHKQRLEVMQQWIESHPLCTGASNYLVPISGIKEGSYFDLCCKILFVDDRGPDFATVIYVWDGTDALPKMPSTVQETEDDEFPVNSCKEISHPYYSLPREVLFQLPPLGTMLPVVPEITPDDLPGQLPQRGNWVKLRNLACRRKSAVEVEVVFTRESKMERVNIDKTGVFYLLCSLYEERRLSGDGRLPQPCPKPPQSLTVTDYEHVPLSTLREVLAYPEVTYKFRCLVRVISTWPSAVVDFCVPPPSNEEGNEDGEATGGMNSQSDGATGEATGGMDSQCVYAVALTLEDPTARLQAWLYGEDGAKFFNGHVPADLHDYSPTVAALERKVHKLLGMRQHQGDGLPSFRDPPWIKCCIKSYYTVKENPHESRRFRIFATTFPG